jgi:hypothetical protein
MALTRRVLLGAGISAGLWAWRSDASAEASKPTPGPDGFFALDAAPASLKLAGPPAEAARGGGGGRGGGEGRSVWYAR